MAFDPWQHMDRVRGGQLQQHENSSRVASAHCFTTSTGWGELTYADCFVFGVRFIAKPFVAYGFDLDAAIDLVPTRYPRCSGFVYRWQVDSSGLYTGAWLAVTVDDQSPFITTAALSPNYVLNHAFTFTGIAMKAVPDYLAQG